MFFCNNHKSQNYVNKLMSIDDQMDKENGVSPWNGILSHFQQKEILTLSTTWLALEAIMLSEMNQE